MAIIINNDHCYNILELSIYSSKKSRFSEKLIFYISIGLIVLRSRNSDDILFFSFSFSLFIQQSLYELSRNIAWYVNFLLVEVMTTTRNWIFLIAPVDLVHNVNDWSTQYIINLLFSSVQMNTPIDDPI
jgi:hypothetical protein